MSKYQGKGPYLEQLGVPLDSVAACPFCKRKNLSREFYSIHCNSCGADGPECDRRAQLIDLIAAWNRCMV